MSIQVGQTAPDFTLTTSDNSEVSLSEFKGKNLLILFFPKAFTGVCTAEMCSTRDDIAAYNAMNADVLAISVDSPDVQAQFKSENDLNFVLASDEATSISQAYCGLYESTGKAKRSAFVVDADGVVRYAEVLENPLNQPNFDSIKAILADMTA